MNKYYRIGNFSIEYHPYFDWKFLLETVLIKFQRPMKNWNWVRFCFLKFTFEYFKFTPLPKFYKK